MKIIKIFLFSLFLFSLDAKSYKRPFYVKESTWKEASPYFLPLNHPIKKTLDKIFKKKRVIHDLNTMEQGGFIDPKIRKWTKLVVTEHPLLKGYVVKAYLDVQSPHRKLPEQVFWIKRIEGVALIKKKIEEQKSENFFKVPKKWIYPLPENPLPIDKRFPKFFILVEEKMEILSREKQREMWLSEKITEEFLFSLYTIISSLGLKDCCKSDNIPFCTDGRLAFVDTQSHGFSFSNYNRLFPYLLPPLKEYWRSLFEKENE